MIDIKQLTEKDIGRFVEYNSGYKKQLGRIKSWNDKYVFVVYNCNREWKDSKNYTAQATRPDDLNFSDQPVEDFV